MTCARPSAVARRHDLANPQRYCVPLISSRANPIRIPMTLLCVHRRLQSRPISMPRLITASARPSAVVRRLDLASLQRYCAPLISSRTNLIRIPITLLCAHRRSQSRLISTPRLITAPARPPAVVRRHDLANPQRYCAPLISSRAPTPLTYPHHPHAPLAPSVWRLPYGPDPLRHEHAPRRACKSAADSQGRRRIAHVQFMSCRTDWHFITVSDGHCPCLGARAGDTSAASRAYAAT